MAVTITLPDGLAVRLQREAAVQHRTVEEVALDILNDALKPESSIPTLEDVVAKIKATLPNPKSIRPAHGSLADALRDADENVDFDVTRWGDKWAAVEAEMKAITRANDVAEGRR